MTWKEKFKIGLCIIVVIFCGCQIEPLAAVSHLEEDMTEGLKISADIFIPEKFEQGTAKTMEVQRRRFTLEEALQLLWRDKEIEQTLSDDSFEEADLGNYQIDTLYGMDGSFLDVGGASLYYYTSLYKYIEKSIVTDSTVSSYNMDKFQKENLAFMERKECIETVKALLAQFDITVSDNFQCYALDYQTLQEEEVTLDINDNPQPEEAKPSWTEADECYYFKFSQEYDGVEIYNGGYGDYITGNGYPETAIEVIYGREGVVYLRIQNVYQGIGESVEKVTLNKIEDLIEGLQKKYALLIPTQTDTVTDVKLLYIPCDSGNNKTSLIPAWIVQIETPVEGMGNYRSTVLINGITGKELY